MKLPFRRKFWVIGHHLDWDLIRQFTIKKARLNPVAFAEVLVDGPFDNQEEAARALAFWKLQYGENKILRMK